MRRRLLRSIVMVIMVTVIALGLPLGVVSWRLVDDLVHSNITSQLEAINASLNAQQFTDGAMDLRSVSVSVPPGWRLEYERGGVGQAVGAEPLAVSVSDAVTSISNGKLTLYSPVDRLRREQFLALGLVALAVLASIVVGVGVALITSRRLTHPLSDLADRAARLGSGDFRTFKRRYQIAELDRVAEVLDSAAGDISTVLQRERDLASEISHQLRTRLTGLQLRLEELAEYPDDVVRADVSAALEQTDRLVNIVNDLLANARSQRAASAAEISLSTALEQVRTEWVTVYAAAGRTLTVICPPQIVVKATAVRLREALGVLLDNALMHGAGAVRVTVKQGEPLVLLEVADEGDGVGEKLAGHIFDRGISGADSSGLGLALARAFIEADGGRLELRRARPPVFGMFLVRADPDDSAPSGSVPNGSAPSVFAPHSIGAPGGSPRIPPPWDAPTRFC
ncbi:sensor histidine kinase [Nakamurella antarctica]|uniref:Signal transduction histidine-protein kinase/phosphatase MprB n=1 Tax=Nakamurella antarctica TaxID=1902245 RepID=A0A3G8ZP46_9ACTN|nr:HAMP domain-containing sensor histidine kinase [Nakamurella antarctica]AZI58545.1 sensor histidine kinase [Nakamurella antarctica]